MNTHRYFRFIVFAVLLLLSVGVGSAHAQSTLADAEIESGVHIYWPRPISEVWGTVDIVGTANVPDQVAYRLEAIELNDEMQVPEDAAWLSVSQIFDSPVSRGALATIDTREAPDGLYALKLVAYYQDADGVLLSVETVTGPIRVNNEFPLDGVEPEIPEDGTVPPSPPETELEGPFVVTVAGSPAVNMRRCDLADNDRCPVVGALIDREQGGILGTSSTGSGWYLVRNSGGLQGWMSHTVVTAYGDLTEVPLVAPPEPLSPPAAPPSSSRQVILPHRR